MTRFETELEALALAERVRFEAVAAAQTEGRRVVALLEAVAARVEQEAGEVLADAQLAPAEVAL